MKLLQSQQIATTTPLHQFTEEELKLVTIKEEKMDKLIYKALA